jgi:hypothetical protein
VLQACDDSLFRLAQGEARESGKFISSPKCRNLDLFNILKVFNISGNRSVGLGPSNFIPTAECRQLCDGPSTLR